MRILLETERQSPEETILTTALKRLTPWLSETNATSCYRYWGRGLWTDYAREVTGMAGQVARRKAAQIQSMRPLSKGWRMRG